MRPSESAAIRPYLQAAVDGIDYFLNCEKSRKRDESELFELFELMAADKTPPKVKGRGNPPLKPEHYAALEWRTVDGEPITDGQREAILGGVLPGEPTSEEERADLQFACRGGWRESSRQASVWLRNAGQTVEADGIDAALRRLPDEPREAAELPGYREAMHAAAEQVRAILAACLEVQTPAGSREKSIESPNPEIVDDLPIEIQELIKDLPVDDTLGLREAYRRDHLWLKWNEGGNRFGPAKIRDRWNSLLEDHRRIVSPRLPGSVGKGASGAATVKEGIKKARKEAQRVKVSSTRKRSIRSRSVKKV